MTEEHGALLEIVDKLEQAWNNGDSVAWTAQVPTLEDTLAQAHPFKGDSPAK